MAVAMQKSSDDWEKQLKNVDILGGISNTLTKVSDNITRGVNDFANVDGLVNSNQIGGILQTANALGGGLNTIEGAIATISGFGNANNAFGPCNESTLNPQTQYDLAPVPLGYQYEYCIPPIAEVYGTGVGANLVPIVTNGAIFSIEVISGGVGYTAPLPISIVDNSGYGSGAKAEAIIENGVITGAIVIYSGSGYCGGNYNNIGIETTQQSTTGVSTSIVGIVTSIHIVTPGIGYTSGDTISIGTTSFIPTITPNGSIVQVNVPTNYNQTFGSTPTITINTSTGVGAKVIPVMKFTPQGATVNENATINVNQSQVINVVDCI
jgi:hypothetical protein